MSEINSIIQKSIQGNISTEENQQLHQWIQKSLENKKQYFAEKDIWDTYGFHSNQKKYEVNPELELLKKRVISIKPQRTIQFRQILQIAALLLVMFGLGWASQFISFTNNLQTGDILMQEIFVPKGQVSQVFLADGTRIWINSESKLIVPSVFSTNERVVRLNGEAFFVVAKNKKKPFRVELNGQQIEVLGTSFNVRAYDNSNKIETTLETGQIQLRTGNQITLLKPGEQSFFDKTTRNLIIKKVDPSFFSSWKKGRFEFQNEDLMEVFKVIERWYDVEIIADESYFKGMHFSGVIKRNKDVKHFLELLNLSIPIKYQFNVDKVKISAK